jgi:nucleotide-binding universal stress UspA family protein
MTNLTREARPRDDRRTTVVIGIDGSETSMRAAAYAIGLAARQPAHLVFLHVTNTASASMAPQVLPEMLTTGTDAAATLRATLETAIDNPDTVWELRHTVGNPFHELTRLADEVAADLVVVGASTQLGHRLVGSLAVHLVKCRRWPVTVVP